MEPGNPAYNIHYTVRVLGPVDRALLRRAVNASIARHEVLRTTFKVVDGRPVQVVAPSLEIDLPVIDLQGLPESERPAAGLRTGIEFASSRFDLERGPLVRVGLARLGPEDHILMMCMHHIITDRWSFDIFEREISQVYVRPARRSTGGAPPASDPVRRFRRLAARGAFRRASRAPPLAYWRDRLAGVPTVLEIPPDRPRPRVQSFGGARATIIYPDAVLTALKEVSRRAGATMFMTVLAALDVLCWKYTGQRDLLLGSTIADRNRPETENVIGYFLNMLLLRARLDPAMTFNQLLAQVRDAARSAYAHQDVPFATLVAELRPRQDPSRNPLIQVSLIYLDFPSLDTPEFIGWSAEVLDIDNGASRFDITLACTEATGMGIHTYVEYNTDIYTPAKADRMLRHLGRILESVAAEPDRPLGEIAMLTDEEQRSRVVDFNATQRGYPEACLHQLFEAAAAADGGAPALVHDGKTTTRGELNAAANRLVHPLRALGVGPGSFVPVCARRSRDQAAGILAVLKAGGAYVPLDASLPAERMAKMFADLRPAVVLGQRDLRVSLPGSGAAWLDVEAAWDEPATRHDENPARRAKPDDLAYVMFTSGSTGTPKGVLVPHHAIVNRLQWAQERHPVAPGERVLHNASFAFDIAIWELLGVMAAGAVAVIPREGEHKDPAALARLIRDERITVAHFVPSMLRLLLETPEADECRSLRAVFCGGEGMDRELHDRFFEKMPSAPWPTSTGRRKRPSAAWRGSARPIWSPARCPSAGPSPTSASICSTRRSSRCRQEFPARSPSAGRDWRGAICSAPSLPPSASFPIRSRGWPARVSTAPAIGRNSARTGPWNSWGAWITSSRCAASASSRGRSRRRSRPFGACSGRSPSRAEKARRAGLSPTSCPTASRPTRWSCAPPYAARCPST
jgi:non-ribosomal peptide synthetase component F